MTPVELRISERESEVAGGYHCQTAIGEIGLAVMVHYDLLIRLTDQRAS